MKKLTSIFLSALIGFLFSSSALFAEHPTEHPTKAKSSFFEHISKDTNMSEKEAEEMAEDAEEMAEEAEEMAEDAEEMAEEALKDHPSSEHPF